MHIFLHHDMDELREGALYRLFLRSVCQLMTVAEMVGRFEINENDMTNLSRFFMAYDVHHHKHEQIVKEFKAAINCNLRRMKGFIPVNVHVHLFYSIHSILNSTISFQWVI